jgi:hypothetical protein
MKNSKIPDCPLYTSCNGRKYPICPLCGDKRRMKTTVSNKTKRVRRVMEVNATRI